LKAFGSSGFCVGEPLLKLLVELVKAYVACGGDGNRQPSRLR
jgi:hypothetical protein